MKPYLILLAFLLASFVVSAQQNAPVAGQASILADLLKKDYSSIDPDLRGDQIVQDRALVVSIFRSFLRANYAHKFTAQTVLQIDIDSSVSKYTVYSRAKKLAAVPQVSSVSTTNEKVITQINATQDHNNYRLDTARQAYYKAQYTTDNEQLAAISQDYDQDQDTLVTSVIALFQNKYTALQTNMADTLATVNANASVQKALPLLGGSLDVSTTEIIDGISKFLAKRIKEELMSFAINNIQTWINKNKSTPPIEELLVLLPTTANYLAHFDPDKLSSFPTELKQYIQNDLDHLVDNAYNLKTTTTFQKLIAGHPDLELAFDALPLIGKINDVQYPGDYFNILASSQLVTDLQNRADVTSKNIASFVNLLEMLSNSITITTNGEPSYTTVNFWKTYGKELPFMKLYFGFLYQQDIKYYDIKLTRRNLSVISLATELQTLMTDESKVEAMFKTVAPMFTNICKSSEKIYQQAQTIKKLNNAGQAIGADTVYNFARSIIDLTSDLGTDADQLFTLFSGSSQDNLHLTDKMKPFILVAGTCNDAVRDIRSKNYADGISQLLNLYNTLDPGTVPALQQYLAFASFSTQTNPVWGAWKIMDTLQSHPAAAPRWRSIAAIKISTELTDIRNFYCQNTHADPDTLAVLDELIGSLKALAPGTDLPANSANDLKNLITLPQFRKLIISYYSGFLIPVTNDLKAEMEALRDKKGNPVFTQAQADLFATDIEGYVSLVFTTKLMNTTPSATDFSNAEKKILTDIETYLTAHPIVSEQFDATAVSIIHFVNDMAMAKTSDDVEAAIEAFALPAGSYSVKQKSSFTVGINSYPGLLPAWEIGGGTGVKNSFSVGFTAPVGIGVSWGNVWGKNDLGFFIPVIDVGAVTQVRLGNNTNTAALPQLSWSNFLSPGLFATFGLYNTPFSFNLGVQYGPEIRNTNQSSSGSNTYRVGIGITIDIPIFNFYTKPAATK